MHFAFAVFFVSSPRLPNSKLKRLVEKNLGPGRAIPLDTYISTLSWGERGVLAEDTEGGAVMAGKVSLTWLNRLHDEVPPADDWAAEALASLLG